MRERTTWNSDLSKQASSKTADPYLMNQDHVNKQPPADKYLTGDPSSFAEDVHPSKDTWEAEYQNGEVKRDAIGLPEMRSDTFNHPEKTASRDLIVKKANIAIEVAKKMLGPKAKEAAVEDQAVALMNLPDEALVETFRRLAGDDMEQTAEMQQQSQMQQAQAAYQAAEEQCKAAIQAGDQEGQKTAIQAMIEAQMQQQAIQAQMQQQAPTAQQTQQQAPTAQGQQTQQAQQQTQQAPTAQGQQQTQQAQMQQEAIQADEALLDDMLGDEPPVAEMDIEMDAPSMDVGDAGLGPEDEVLKTLFATDEQTQQGQAEEQQKQAGMSRTAATRTIGTRPTGGVSRVGGGAGGSRGSETDKLASLWQSAPDVKDVFG